MGITELLVTFSVAIISKLGLAGIAVLMALESMIVPVPSEAVMPFAGFLWFKGTFTLIGILVASTLGSLIGSLISYYVGALWGEAIIKHWGKYVLLNEHHLAATHRFFATYGDKTVFISRFIPVVRHLISIPAGLGGMRPSKFIVYTAAGALLWNGFLAWVGYRLGSHWEIIHKYSTVLDIVLALLLVGAAVYFWYKQRQKTTPSIST